MGAYKLCESDDNCSEFGYGCYFCGAWLCPEHMAAAEHISKCPVDEIGQPLEGSIKL